MFADYRVPQVLNTMGCISYSPPLNEAIKEKQVLASGSSWEMQMRGELLLCSSCWVAFADKRGRDSLQHLVCRTHQEGDQEEPPRSRDQCHPDRLLSVRSDERHGVQGTRNSPTSSHKEHLVLNEMQAMWSSILGCFHIRPIYLPVCKAESIYLDTQPRCLPPCQAKPVKHILTANAFNS